MISLSLVILELRKSIVILIETFMGTVFSYVLQQCKTSHFEDKATDCIWSLPETKIRNHYLYLLVAPKLITSSLVFLLVFFNKYNKGIILFYIKLISFWRKGDEAKDTCKYSAQSQSPWLWMLRCFPGKTFRFSPLSNYRVRAGVQWVAMLEDYA